jgi:hypothetical protein
MAAKDPAARAIHLELAERYARMSESGVESGSRQAEEAQSEAR